MYVYIYTLYQTMIISITMESSSLLYRVVVIDVGQHLEGMSTMGTPFPPRECWGQKPET